MESIIMENKGIITLGDKVMVSDPCYGLGTWCQGVLENVLPGQYDCNVEYSDEGDWGTRVSAIEVTHVNYDRCALDEELEKFEVGVDSGQAGIFDYEYYAKYHMDAKERPHVDDNWYEIVGSKTYVREKNPNYEEFYWEDASDTIENLLAKLTALDEYRESIKSMKYLHKLDGNTIDGLGFVSSSGYGDGGYDCWTCRNDEGKVVSIRVEFISEYEEDEEE